MGRWGKAPYPKMLRYLFLEMFGLRLTAPYAFIVRARGGAVKVGEDTKRRCLKMAKAGHERQRLFPQHFWASENRVQKERHSRNYFHKEFPSGMSYKPAGKDDGIFRPLPKRLFWILWCRWRMLRARLNSSHSAATFVLPRSRKRRKSRSCFTYAKLPSA